NRRARSISTRLGIRGVAFGRGSRHHRGMIRIVIAVALFLAGAAVAERPEDEWKPVGTSLSTPWTAAVSPGNAWPEYPRPQLVRTEWRNLNGLWDYAVRT